MVIRTETVPAQCPVLLVAPTARCVHSLAFLSLRSGSQTLAISCTGLAAHSEHPKLSSRRTVNAQSLPQGQSVCEAPLPASNG